MIKVSLTGIKGFNEALQRKNDQLTNGMEAEMKASIIEINQQQKSLAPVDFGLLRSSLKWAKAASLNYNVVSTGPGSSYAPYQEFGTGGMATIPAGLEDEASQFRGKGKRTINMKAQPFFYAPAFKEWKELKKRIENMLKK